MRVHVRVLKCNMSFVCFFFLLSAKATSVIQEVGAASCKYFNDDNSNIHKRKWHNKPTSNRQQFPTEMESRFIIAGDEKEGGRQAVLSGVGFYSGGEEQERWRLCPGWVGTLNAVKSSPF